MLSKTLHTFIVESCFLMFFLLSLLENLRGYSQKKLTLCPEIQSWLPFEMAPFWGETFGGFFRGFLGSEEIPSHGCEFLGEARGFLVP